MALRKIITDNDPVLHKKSREITAFDNRLSELMDDLIETLHHFDNAVGLAAPQVGILRRAVVIDVGEGVIELINPEIISATGKQVGQEGCMSFPGCWGTVERPMNVKVKAYDRKGNPFFLEGTELLARAFCHEIDHLDGIVFIDRAVDVHKE